MGRIKSTNRCPCSCLINLCCKWLLQHFAVLISPFPFLIFAVCKHAEHDASVLISFRLSSTRLSLNGLIYLFKVCWMINLIISALSWHAQQVTRLPVSLTCHIITECIPTPSMHSVNWACSIPPHSHFIAPHLSCRPLICASNHSLLASPTQLKVTTPLWLTATDIFPQFH